MGDIDNITPKPGTSRDHDYCEKEVTGSSQKNLKRKFVYESMKPAKTSKNLRSKNISTNELIKLSSDTVVSLSEINDNTKSISLSIEKISQHTESVAQSMQILANFAKQYNK